MPQSAVLSLSVPGRDDDHPAFGLDYDTTDGSSRFVVNQSMNVEGKALDVELSGNTKGGAAIEVSHDLGADIGTVSVSHDFKSGNQSVGLDWSKDALTLKPRFNLADNSYSVSATQSGVGRDGDELTLSYNSAQDVSATYKVDDLSVGLSSNINNMAPKLSLSYSSSFDI